MQSITYVLYHIYKCTRVHNRKHLHEVISKIDVSIHRWYYVKKIFSIVNSTSLGKIKFFRKGRNSKNLTLREVDTIYILLR